jgi:hypothetical protein
VTSLAHSSPTFLGRNVAYHLQLVWSKDVSQAQSAEARAVSDVIQEVVKQWNKRTETPERNIADVIDDALHALRETYNSARDRQIADRLEALSLDAESEDQAVAPNSVVQFRDFFLNHRELAVPKITLTPDGTLRVRWIRGSGNFFALEFTGGGLAKIVAEIPREHGLTAKYFASEPISGIIDFARAIRASLA